MLTTSSSDTPEGHRTFGWGHLENGRLDEAECVFVNLLREDSQDVEAYRALGDIYRARGDYEAAVLLYSEALRYAPQDLGTRERRIEAIHLLADSLQVNSGDRAMKLAQGLDQPGSNDPESIRAQLQRLTGQAVPVTEGEVIRAEAVLEEVMSSSSPAQVVAKHIDEVDSLLPALLELNIRRARTDGRPDLAQGLQALLNNIHLQLSSRLKSSKTTQSWPDKAAPLDRTPYRALFLSPGEGASLLRQTLPADALSALGCEVTVATEFPPGFHQRFDVVLVHRPHGNPGLLQGLAACAAADVPIIVDLDVDFEQMPAGHPEYPVYGLGSPAGLKAYTAALLLADAVSVSSETLAGRLQASGYSPTVIPDGWTRANPLWEKPALRRATLNLGWIGRPGQIEDVAQIRRIVLRLLREFDQVRLVIIGDPQIYQVFDGLPESRRLFLPAVSLEDYPYLLAQLDILMAPLRSTPFNQSLSDHLLVDAGVRSIPWVASSMASFSAWGAGGLLANSPDEWHTHLRHLIVDAELRTALGWDGRRKAEEREMAYLVEAWYGLIDDTVQRRTG